MTGAPDASIDDDVPSPADLAFLGLEPGEQPGRYRLPVVEALCTPVGFLYGGSGMAACVAAAEHHTGWPISWITVQYVSNAFPGEVVDLEVSVPARGRVTAQVEVIGHVGDRRVVTAIGAITGRPRDRIHWWGSMPVVPPPDECDVLRLPFDDRAPSSFVRTLGRRLALGSAGSTVDGRMAVWSRVAEWEGPSAARLGYVADIVPLVLSMALGKEHGGTSLDNTIRMIDRRIDASGWVLVEVESQGFSHSIGHGQVRLWSPSGDLLALAEQTCILRTSHHDRPRPESG